MPDIGTEFISYLKAYDPEAFSKVSADSATDSLINTIIAKHKSEFDIWKKTPEWLRAQYGNKIPEDILDMVRQGVPLTPENVAAKQNHTQVNVNDKRPSDLGVDIDLGTQIAFGAAELAAIKTLASTIQSKGYSKKAATQLATSSQIRVQLQQKLEQALPEQKAQLLEDWQKTRAHDVKTIKTDWAQNQPEKLFVHLVKEIDRGHESFSSALPKLDTLMQNISKQGRENDLIAYLQSPQSRSRHYSPQTKLAVEYMLENYCPHLKQQTNLSSNVQQNTAQIAEAPYKNTPSQDTGALRAAVSAKYNSGR